MTPDSVSVDVPILNWFDQPIRQSIQSVFNDLNTGTEALDIFHKYRKNHFARLVETLRYIKILGMSEPILLTDIYSPAMVSTTIFGRLYEQEWLSASSAETPSPTRRRPAGKLTRADEFIEDHSRVVVLGSAGSGKTTLLRHIALSMCDKTIFDDTLLKTSRFPFFIHLPKYARESNGTESIVDYLSRVLEQYTDNYARYFVKRVLSRGLAVVVLDSLDEVQPSVRQAVVEQIRDTAAGYPKCQIVVSCRTADYSPISDNFHEVELARLTEPAVHTIVIAWFHDEARMATKLLAHLQRDESVRSLCETPLLLSLLCIQFRHDLALPKRKTELFKRCIDAFLRAWDASRGFRRDTAYSSLSDDRKEKLFETVAGQAFSGNDIRYTFPEAEVVGWIEQCCDLFGMKPGEGNGILTEIEAHHGILERYSADSYMFSHPSFQEYFAARNLLLERRELEVLRKNIDDERWAGVIEFTAAMHADPTPLLEYLANKSEMGSLKTAVPMARRTHTLLLLYRCLASGVNIPNHVRKRLYRGIVEAQIHMSETLRGGGVFPIAMLAEDGVRHTYLYYRRRRTLAEALQPLRRLANEILLSPSDIYSEIALSRLREMRRDAIGKKATVHTELESVAITLCLAVPIASSRSEEVKWLLTDLKRGNMREYVADMVDYSLQAIESTWGAGRRSR